MIPLWREELKQLAELESADATAISFYYQPENPKNKAHREEAILVKDLVREAKRRLAREGNGSQLHELLDRILVISEGLKGNHSRAKAIFACQDKDLWREFDLPANGSKTQLHINTRFQLKPLAAMVLTSPHCCVALIDRENARILDCYMEQISLREHIKDELPRRVKTAGFLGYDAGHIERHVDNEAMRHFKRVADRLQEIQIQGAMDALVIGCRPELWPEIEPHLHPYVRQKVIGRLAMDTQTVTTRAVLQKVSRILAEQKASEDQALIREVLGEAQRNGRGSLGLRRVMNSLERGEVQTLLIGDGFSGSAVECRNCGHLDTRIVTRCAVCGQAPREVNDVSGALVSQALRRGVDVVYLIQDEAFARSGNIGALLRFRADQNTSERMVG